MVTSINYPPDLPLGAVQEVVRIGRGGIPGIQAEASTFFKDAWIVQGYLQKVALGEPTAVMSIASPVEQTAEASGEESEKVGELTETEQTIPVAPGLVLKIGPDEELAPFPALTDEQGFHALESLGHGVSPSIKKAALPIPTLLILEWLTPFILKAIKKLLERQAAGN